MDDDLEDEVFYQTVLSHVKFLSKLVISFPPNFSPMSYLLRYVRFYVLKPETIIVALIVLFLLTFFHSLELFIRSAVSKIQHVGSSSKKDVGSFRILSNPLSEKTTWEFKEGNAGVYALQGRRPKMEDRFSIIHDDDKSGISIYAVFDGHGGDSAADFVEKRLANCIISRVNEAGSINADLSQIMTEEILNIDKQLIENSKKIRDLAGTTALVALTHQGKLLVANVGDSRGVICDNRGSAIPLSFDHKPQQLKERKRIAEAGGFVSFNGVWRVAGILATSRALGDYPLKERKLVIAEPDVLTFDLEDLHPQFMILASDGLWDTFTNEEAVAHVKANLNRESDFGAKSITQQAYQKGSVDNITVIVVKFKDGYSSNDTFISRYTSNYNKND